MTYVLKNAKLAYSGRMADIVLDQGQAKTFLHDTGNTGIYAPVSGDGLAEVDLQGRLVLKGFGDLHLHLDKACVGEKVENKTGTLTEAISIMSRYKEKMTYEDMLERAVKTLQMCYEHGTRFIRTHVDIDAKTGVMPVKVMKELKKKYEGRMKIQVTAFPQEGIVGKRENYLALDQALAEGADCVGGIPAEETDPREHIDMIFALAHRYDVDVDMHIDETDDSRKDTLSVLAEETIRMGWQGRVFAGHLCSLAAKPSKEAGEILKKVRQAGITVISLPSTNLYLQGRSAAYNAPRGIAPVKRISEEFEIPVILGSDNIRDPFNPFGNGNMLETALIAAHGCHMGGTKDMERLFDMIGKTPMELLGIEPETKDGIWGDFIILDAKTPSEAIITHRKPWAYVEKGILYGGVKL